MDIDPKQWLSSMALSEIMCGEVTPCVLTCCQYRRRVRRRGVTTDPPTASWASVEAISPWTWNSGIGSRRPPHQAGSTRRSPAATPSGCAAAAAPASAAWWCRSCAAAGPRPPASPGRMTAAPSPRYRPPTAAADPAAGPARPRSSAHRPPGGRPPPWPAWTTSRLGSRSFR